MSDLSSKIDTSNGISSEHIKLAKEMGTGKNIVTILCDDGRRYASKIFN